MKTETALSDRLRSLFETTPQGTVGLVEELLSLAREQPLQCEWRAEGCWVGGLSGGTLEAIEVPLPKGVFRAVLARVAALCNEQTSDSVSPYGGEAVLRDYPQPLDSIQVSFTNTPAVQRLELRPGTDGGEVD